MMQRLLQQDNQNELNQQQNSTARSTPFGFTTTTTATAVASANVLHHHPSSAFLRPTAVKKDGDTKEADDESSCKDVDSTPSTNAEDELQHNSIRLCNNNSGDKSPQTNGDNKNCSNSSRLSEESSMDVEDACHDRGVGEDDDEDERLSSDEDYLNVDEDDDVGSPVDLTSRHRLLNRLNVATVTPDKLPFRQMDVSSPSTVSEANEDNLQSPPPSRQHDHRDRRLAFSVENILDPNKFTGKEKEAGVLRPAFHTHWRPHLDITSSSPDFVNSSGMYPIIHSLGY